LGKKKKKERGKVKKKDEKKVKKRRGMHCGLLL
jgi:hypothetical protein